MKRPARLLVPPAVALAVLAEGGLVPAGAYMEWYQWSRPKKGVSARLGSPKVPAKYVVHVRRTKARTGARQVRIAYRRLERGKLTGRVHRSEWRPLPAGKRLKLRAGKAFCGDGRSGYRVRVLLRFKDDGSWRQQRLRRYDAVHAMC